MRTKRGTGYNPRTQHFTYEINGKEYWVQGENYYNCEKKRYEHIHIGSRGGETLIFWTEKERNR